MDGQERRRDDEPGERGGIVEGQLEGDQPSLRVAEQEHGQAGMAPARPPSRAARTSAT